MVRTIINKIKYFFQIHIKGYSDESLWNVDYFLGTQIIKVLKAFKKIKRCGYPSQLKNQKEWEKILKEMIEGFEFLIDDEKIFEFKNNKKYNKKYEEAKKKAMNFINYFNGLWD